MHFANTSASLSCFNGYSGCYCHDSKNVFISSRFHNHISHHPKKSMPLSLHSLIVSVPKASEFPLKIALSLLHKF